MMFGIYHIVILGQFQINSIIWSFLNIYKNNSKNGYFISKLNYFISFLITTSLLFPTHDQDGYEKAN